MADLSVDISSLPLEIRAKLAELDLELSEGKPPCVIYKHEMIMRGVQPGKDPSSHSGQETQFPNRCLPIISDYQNDSYVLHP